MGIKALRCFIEIPPHLVEQISRGKCVLFIGAGVSKSAGLPNWSDLLHNMLKYCEENTIQIPNSSEIEEEIIEESYLIAADQIRECMDKHNTLAFHRFIIIFGQLFRYLRRPLKRRVK